MCWAKTGRCLCVCVWGGGCKGDQIEDVGPLGLALDDAAPLKDESRAAVRFNIHSKTRIDDACRNN